MTYMSCQRHTKTCWPEVSRQSRNEGRDSVGFLDASPYSGVLSLSGDMTTNSHSHCTLGIMWRRAVPGRGPSLLDVHLYLGTDALSVACTAKFVP